MKFFDEIGRHPKSVDYLDLVDQLDDLEGLAEEYETLEPEIGEEDLSASEDFEVDEIAEEEFPYEEFHTEELVFEELPSDELLFEEPSSQESGPEVEQMEEDESYIEENNADGDEAEFDDAEIEEGIEDIDETDETVEAEEDETEEVDTEDVDAEDVETDEFVLAQEADALIEDDISEEELSDEELSDEELSDEDMSDEDQFDEDLEEVTFEQEEKESRILNRILIWFGAAALFLMLGCGLYLVLHPNKPVAPAGPILTGTPELIGAGAQLAGIDVIGGRGLELAMNQQRDAILERIAAEEALKDQEQDSGYQEVALENEVNLKIETVSVCKDLKIKLTNAETKKLVANIPFTLTIKDPKGKLVSWTDEDQDGILYNKNLAAGDYTIHVEPLTQDERYANYIWPKDSTVSVKGEIAYNKIDVADEVKKPGEVNEGQEDTGHKKPAGGESQTVSASTNPGTTKPTTPAEPADPTKPADADQYVEVKKGDIPDPMSLALASFGDNRYESLLDDPNDGNDVSGNDVPSNLTDVISLSKSEAVVYMGTPITLEVKLTGVSENTVSAESSNPTVATVALEGTNLVVTPVSAGKTEISVVSSAAPEQKAICRVQVKQSVQEDDASRLRDAQKRELYVLENGAFRPAYFKDYYLFDTFYYQKEAKLTGWQTIGGKTYYYDANGEKVTGQQTISGITYTFSADGVLEKSSGTLGIDVSKWNGKIDWEKVAASGVQYAIIRVGYRGSSQGALIDDSSFQANIKGATAAGIKVGVYFFTQAVDEVEAVYEASMVLDRIAGYHLDYPVFIDVEASGGRGDKISVSERTAVIKSFCETIRNGGYKAGIYANKTWLEEKMNMSSLSAYPVWLAQYIDKPTYSGRYNMWQYTAKGIVDGISGDVDLDISY